MVEAKNGLIQTEDREIAIQQEIPENGFMSMIERIVTNPDVDVEKLQRIMDMQEHVLDRNARQAFNAAMVRAQGKIKIVHAESKNEQTNSRYAKHEAIVKEIAPIYTAEGFSLSFYEGETQKEKHIRVMVDVMHEQGHTLVRHLDVAIDDAGIKGSVNKTIVHAEGSSFTYGKRRLTCMIFNIPTGDDDDGNAAGAKYISETQQADIKALIQEVKADKTKFLKFLKVDSIETIPEKAYQVAVQSLEAKRKKERVPGEEG